MKATGETPTVATQEGPAKVKLPAFQAFDVSSGDTVQPVLIRITSVLRSQFCSFYCFFACDTPTGRVCRECCAWFMGTDI